MRSIRVLILLVVFALIAGACNDDSGDTTAATGASGETATTAEAETTTTTTTEVVVPTALPELNPPSISSDDIDPYVPVITVGMVGLDRCEWIGSGSADLWALCSDMVESDVEPSEIARDFVGEETPTEIRDDAGHICFIDTDEIVTPAEPDEVAEYTAARFNPDAFDLPGGLLGYFVDDPIAAARDLTAAGIPASPRYVLVPSPRWKFGGAGGAIPADPVLANSQGSFSWGVGTGVVVTIIDTGTAADESALSNVSEAIRGHGEFIAGIVNRLVPQANVFQRSALVENAGASAVATEHSLVAALDSALTPVTSGGQTEGGELLLGEGGVVNLSLGTYACEQDQIPLELAARFGELAKSDNWSHRNVVFVAAAGNDGHGPTDPPFWPAGFADPVLLETGMATWANLGNYPEFESAIMSLLAAQTDAPIVIGVGAQVYDKSAPDSPKWLPAAFSNQVAATVWAPGANIVSNYPDWDGFAQWDGTSFAAPYVAALIASCHEPSNQGDYRDILASIIASGTC